MKLDRRFLAFVLVLSAVWWFFALARGCQGGKPRPLDVVPAEKRHGEY
jgi:hypothetical protein